MKKKDLWIIGALLLAALLAVLWALWSQRGDATGRVLVYLDGEVCAEGKLGQKDDIVVRGGDGQENVISFTENGVYMAFSTCDNQLCVHQGEVTRDNFSSRALGTRILCLPNRVMVELELRDGAQTDMPDA